MVSLIAAPNQLRLARPSFFPSASSRNQLAVVGRSTRQVLLGFSYYSARGAVVLRCKKFEGHDEGDRNLELEVLKFMKNSVNPNHFPSRKDLIHGGREDLADAIRRKGGWMTLGWDLDEGNQEKQNNEDLNVAIEKWKLSYPGTGQDEAEREGTFSKVASEQETTTESSSSSSSYSDDSQTLVFSSGRSGEAVAKEDEGLIGILNRIGKQRYLSIGNGIHGVKDDGTGSSSSNAENGPHSSLVPGKKGQLMVSPGETMHSDTEKGSDQSVSVKMGGKGDDLHKPDSWRTWSYQRAGHPDKNFEAAEIDYDGSRNEAVLLDPSSMNGVVAFSRDDAREVYAQRKNLTVDQLKSRLKHLEVELSCALRLMKSNWGDLSEKVDITHLPDNVSDLSDACEFQETEIMRSRDELRKLRAKLAVLDGRMSMTISDAHKVAEEKQKKIEYNRKAIMLLRPTCIVWSNSGSEVLLAGSFDGWANRRRMERSSTGIFSICLKLYPGTYEIKFIVDGKWMVDPLRPIVDNNSYRNNILVVSY